MAPAAEEPGLVVARRYRLEALLGEGATGSVWRAEDLKLASPVAVKLMDPDICHDQLLLQRFMREAKAAAALRSPHVVQVMDHGTDGGRPFIVMEMLDGVSLKRYLERKGTLSSDRVATVVTHVARALGKAHDAGVVHRDIKPDNVFLVSNDDEVVAKVLDFGAAKSTALSQPDAVQTDTGVMVGTPYYMSPEQASAKKEVDYRADLWALGVMTFEMLLGFRPFQGGSLGQLIMQICMDPIKRPSEYVEVPDGFDDWFLKAVERDPAERFRSAKEMAESLRSVLFPDAASRPPLSLYKLSLPPPDRNSQPAKVEVVAAPSAARSSAPPVAVAVAVDRRAASPTEPRSGARPRRDQASVAPEALSRSVNWLILIGLALLVALAVVLLTTRSATRNPDPSSSDTANSDGSESP